MIYTVTFNPAIDYSMFIEKIYEGQTNRSQREHIAFGGKGINVSLVLNSLGYRNTALGFIGGFTGLALKDALENGGVKTDFVYLQNGMTRINVKIKGRTETEINANGPNISKKDFDSFLEKLNALQSGDIIILSGSIPKSLPENTYETVLSLLQNKGVDYIVDTTGKSLLAALKYEPLLIKPNKAELEELLNISINSEEDIVNGAKRLKSLGARNIMVSLGEDGAMLLTEKGQILKSHSLCKKAVNTVGAGDSMVAGFVAGIANGYEYAFKLANACGGATAGSMELATKEEIFKLLKGDFNA